MLAAIAGALVVVAGAFWMGRESVILPASNHVVAESSGAGAAASTGPTDLGAESAHTATHKEATTARVADPALTAPIEKVREHFGQYVGKCMYFDNVWICGGVKKDGGAYRVRIEDNRELEDDLLFQCSQKLANVLNANIDEDLKTKGKIFCEIGVLPRDGGGKPVAEIYKVQVHNRAAWLNEELSEQGVMDLDKADAAKKPRMLLKVAAESLLGLARSRIHEQLGKPDRTNPGISDEFFAQGVQVEYDGRVASKVATSDLAPFRGKILGIAIGDSMQECLKAWGLTNVGKAFGGTEPLGDSDFEIWTVKGFSLDVHFSLPKEAGESTPRGENRGTVRSISIEKADAKDVKESTNQDAGSLHQKVVDAAATAKKSREQFEDALIKIGEMSPEEQQQVVHALNLAKEGKFGEMSPKDLDVALSCGLATIPEQEGIRAELAKRAAVPQKATVAPVEKKTMEVPVERLLGLRKDQIREQLGEPDRTGVSKVSKLDYDVFGTGIKVRYDATSHVKEVATSGSGFGGKVLGIAIGDSMQDCVAAWGRPASVLGRTADDPIGSNKSSAAWDQNGFRLFVDFSSAGVTSHRPIVAQNATVTGIAVEFAPRR
jgi:hypothetical protein